MTGIATDVFAGAGAMRAACRAHAWESTTLGVPERWTQSLRTTVQIAMASKVSTIVLWGANLTQIYNDGYATLMGVKHPRGLGQATRECWPEVWEINGPIYQRVLQGETVFLEDALFPITRSGELEDAWFTLTYVPLKDDGGEIAGVLVQVQEVTAQLRETRERDALLLTLDVERMRLEEAFRLAPSFIAVFHGPDMHFTFVNESFYDLTGARAVIGRTMAEALPELEQQGFGELLRRVRTSGEPWVGRDALLHVARGAGPALDGRYVNIIVHAMADADGRPFGVVAHGSDVTEQVMARRAAERMLAESEQARIDAVAARAYADVARANAEQANHSKGRFLAVMSHELRTPLNAIGGYAELMELGIRGPVTPTQLSDLNRIQLSKQHLLGLINEVLDYAKLETGTLEYSLDAVSASDTLVAAEALIAPQARTRRIALTVEACSRRLAARADGDKLRQILVNMLANAVKFTPPGGRVHLSASERDEKVHFTVKDSGIGIEAEQLERIFEPFMQVRSDAARTHEGTGLGLAISRELAHGMAGELSAESRFGHGSTFTLTLPLA